MFCPLCEAEFERPIAQCPNCGAALVSTKEDAEQSAPRSVLWEGNHPDFYRELEAGLAKANIPHYCEKKFRFNYQWPLDEPNFRIFVLDADIRRAKPVLSEVEQLFVTDESRKIGIGDVIHLKNSVPGKISGQWQPSDSAVEVWRGKDSTVAEFIRQALLANYLEYRTREDSWGEERIEVRPSNAKRAREIVREIVEGRPPE